MNDHKTERRSDQACPSNKDQTPIEIDARHLLGEKGEVALIHAGERYRLRVTANNKLILTK